MFSGSGCWRYGGAEVYGDGSGNYAGIVFLHGVAAIFVILRYVKPAMEYIIYYEKVERGKESSAD